MGLPVAQTGHCTWCSVHTEKVALAAALECNLADMAIAPAVLMSQQILFLPGNRTCNLVDWRDGLVSALKLAIVQLRSFVYSDPMRCRILRRRLNEPLLARVFVFPDDWPKES